MSFHIIRDDVLCVFTLTIVYTIISSLNSYPKHWILDFKYILLLLCENKMSEIKVTNIMRFSIAIMTFRIMLSVRSWFH